MYIFVYHMRSKKYRGHVTNHLFWKRDQADDTIVHSINTREILIKECSLPIISIYESLLIVNKD